MLDDKRIEIGNAFIFPHLTKELVTNHIIDWYIINFDWYKCTVSLHDIVYINCKLTIRYISSNHIETILRKLSPF